MATAAAKVARGSAVSSAAVPTAEAKVFTGDTGCSAATSNTRELDQAAVVSRVTNSPCKAATPTESRRSSGFTASTCEAGVGGTTAGDCISDRYLLIPLVCCIR